MTYITLKTCGLKFQLFNNLETESMSCSIKLQETFDGCVLLKINQHFVALINKKGRISTQFPVVAAGKEKAGRIDYDEIQITKHKKR